MKTIKHSKRKKTEYVRLSSLDQGPEVSVRQQAKLTRRLKLHQWSGEKKAKLPKLAFYGRTATLEQGKERAWKIQQIKTANDYLKYLGLPPLSPKNVYLDRGSGANLDLPALSKLIDHVKEGKIKTILVLRLDRLSRNIRNFVTLMDIFDSHGVSLRSVQELVDTSSTTGRLMFSTLRIFSEFEQASLRERQMAGIKRRKQWLAQNGNKHGGKNK